MAMMRCEYTDVSVEWDKEGTSILPMQEPCDCHVTDDGTLHFNNVSIQDEAKYTCIAQMGFTAARCSAYLRIADECENCWSSSRDSSLPILPVTTHTLATSTDTTGIPSSSLERTTEILTLTNPSSVQTTSKDTMATGIPSSSPPRTTKMTNPSSPVVSDVLLSAIVALSTLVLILVVVVVVLVVMLVCIVWRNRRGYGRSGNEGEMDVDLNPAYQTTVSLISSTTNPAYQTTASFVPSTTNPAYAGLPVNIHPPHLYEDVLNYQ